MDKLPSSKNASVLRREDIIPPGRRSAAKAASKSISVSCNGEKKFSLGAAIDEIYRDWKDEAVPAAERTSYQRMEALVYKTVKNFRTCQLPVAKGREILNDINQPDLCLGDVLTVLQKITSAVNKYGFSLARSVTWAKKSLQERAFGVMPKEEEEEEVTDDSTDDESDKLLQLKPRPPYATAAASKKKPHVGRVARKSSGVKAPPLSFSSTQTTTTTIKRRVELEQPKAKRQTKPQEAKAPILPVFVAKTPAVQSLASSFLPFKPPPPVVSLSDLPSPSPSPPQTDQYGWVQPSESAIMTPSSSLHPPVFVEHPSPLPYVPSVHDMLNRLEQIDNQVRLKWHETRSFEDIDHLFRKYNGELSNIDSELIEHWDQLSHCLLLHRLFHERSSRGSLHPPEIVKDVIISVLHGMIAGNMIGKIYDPNLASSRELLYIAQDIERWRTLQSVMTFHMRHNKKDRTLERQRLYATRRVLLMEAGERLP